MYCCECKEELEKSYTAQWLFFAENRIQFPVTVQNSKMDFALFSTFINIIQRGFYSLPSYNDFPS